MFLSLQQNLETDGEAHEPYIDRKEQKEPLASRSILQSTVCLGGRNQNKHTAMILVYKKYISNSNTAPDMAVKVDNKVLHHLWHSQGHPLMAHLQREGNRVLGYYTAFEIYRFKIQNNLYSVTLGWQRLLPAATPQRTLLGISMAQGIRQTSTN